MFQVRWHSAPREALAKVWLESDSETRKLINVAAKEIDLLLKSAPLGAGESRPSGRRILFALPLAAIFRIEQDQRTVSVLELWPVRPRKQ